MKKVPLKSPLRRYIRKFKSKKTPFEASFLEPGNTYRKLRTAVIGLGKQALEDHIPALLSSPDVTLTAVVDIDRNKLKEFSKKHKDVHCYHKIEDLFLSEKLDFIVIVLPHHLHSEVALKALKRGIHVFKEKPFAISLKEARDLISTAEENGVKVSVTLQRRFNPIYVTTLQLLDKIGKPFYIDAKYTIFTNEPHQGWRGDRILAGGGCLIDMGYHMIDLLVWYFGLPDCVSASTSCSAKEDCIYDAEDTALITFKYRKKNLRGSLIVSRVIAPKQEYMEIHGTRGSIHLERGKISRFSPDGTLLESLERQNSWPSAMQDQISAFTRIIRGEKSDSTAATHLEHLAFIEAAYTSATMDSSCIDPHSLL